MINRNSANYNCELCNQDSPIVSQFIGICKHCLRDDFPSAQPQLRVKHAESRQEFDLPTIPPRDEDGILCQLCSNTCQIGDGNFGFCGLRTMKNNRLVHLAGIPERGLLHWYRDPLPTNCVADWVCEGSRQPGYHNLAVFYASCTANCLFCQNWHFRQVKPIKDRTISAAALATNANSRTFCVCFFGGDPSSQMPHTLATANKLAKDGIRICWETNGMMHPKFLKRAMRYSLETGGCIKFDLKAYNEGLHQAISGVSNQRTLENFTLAAKYSAQRPEIPLVIASTLLIPGYIDEYEVSSIAEFIAAIDPDIPYSLLGFAPNFYMSDLPCTSVEQAQSAYHAACKAGLRNVHLGNRHLLGITV